jgi:N-methylhydantoinase A
MARHLSMPRVVVPPVPGLFSSFGLLCSDVEHHFTRTYLHDVRRAHRGELRALFDRMEGEARAQLASEGFAGDAVRIVRSADLRYPGQTYELTVPLDPFAPEPAWADAVAEAFAAEHARTYGHRAAPGVPVEFVGLRVVGRAVPQDPRVPHRVRVRPGDGGAPLGPRRAYFGRALGWRTAAVLRRGDLERPRAGPCIIEEYDATCLVPPGARAALDALGSITIDLT